MRLLACILTLLFALPLLSQSPPNKDSAAVLSEDAAFWEAYNQCDVQKMSQYFTADVEFYHDKGGITLGLGPLTESFKNNLCGNPKFRLRREAVPGTVQLYPLQKNGVTYGAVLSGEHYFYINDNGKPEFRDGQANFFHVWLLHDGQWKIARVVSYNHHQAPPQNAGN